MARNDVEPVRTNGLPAATQPVKYAKKREVQYVILADELQLAIKIILITIIANTVTHWASTKCQLPKYPGLLSSK